MASTSFPFSPQISRRKFPTTPPIRISAAYAAAGVTSQDARPSPEASFYEVLGIRRGATCGEIKSAYRRLARVLHPDAVPGGDAPPSAEAFMRVHAAYATLSDPEKREAYDRSIVRRPRAATVLSAVGCHDAGMRRRTWETEQCW